MTSIEIMNKILELENLYGITNGNSREKSNPNKKNQPDIAKEMGLTMKQYYQYKSLNRLIPEIQSIVDNGISITTVYSTISKITQTEQKELYNKYGSLLSNGVTSHAVQEYIYKIKEDLYGISYERKAKETSRIINRKKIKPKSCNKDKKTKILQTKTHKKVNKSQTQSCNKKEKIKKYHGHNRLLRIFQGMITRCYNTKGNTYKYYGSRGITICQEWLDDFNAFEYWAKNNGYKKKLSIDRIDNNGNYCPENCRWATQTQQQNNTSRNHYITIKGVTHTYAEWEKITGINRYTVGSRVAKGWSYEDAFMTPARKYKDKHNKINEEVI